MMLKKCPRCKGEKPMEDFPRNRSAKDGHTTYCRPCWNEYGKRRYTDPETKERTIAQQKRWRKERPTQYRDQWLRREYGVPYGTYDQMAEQQQGRCKCCGDVPAEPRPGWRPLHVDHCHETGKVRALLCAQCNQGIGHFKHEIARLRLAIQYLEQHS